MRGGIEFILNHWLLMGLNRQIFRYFCKQLNNRLMIKNIFCAALIAAIIGLTTKCQQPRQTGSSASGTETNMNNDPLQDTAIYAILKNINDTPNLSDSLMIRFTAVNPTKDTLKFTQYHTPFEGIISKFLTVTDSNGKEIDYMGPMAKRIMPPPADTYHTLAPGQSESVDFDLKKCYKIEKPGTYTLEYNGENISGIANGKAITITVAE